MNSNELRLGNYILPSHDLDGKYHKVKYLEPGIINDYVENWYSHILLTRHILIKCGFKEDEISRISFHGIPEPLSLYFEEGEVYIEEYSEGAVPLSHIKYLHQIQNFYFALTGEELNINL